MLEDKSPREKTFTCDHCGKTEQAKANGKAPENWDWQFILMNKQYRGRQFWLCPDCQKELYMKLAKTKEAFLLGTTSDEVEKLVWNLAAGYECGAGSYCYDCDWNGITGGCRMRDAIAAAGIQL